MTDIPPPSEMDRREDHEYPDSRGVTERRAYTRETELYTRYATVRVSSEEWDGYVSEPTKGAHTDSERCERDVSVYSPRLSTFDGCEPKGECRVCARTNRDGVLWRHDGETVCDTCYTVVSPTPTERTATRSLIKLRSNYEQIPPKEYENGRPQLAGGSWSQSEADERFA